MFIPRTLSEIRCPDSRRTPCRLPRALGQAGLFMQLSRQPGSNTAARLTRVAGWFRDRLINRGL